VGAILEEDSIVLVAKLLNSGHVGNFTAHVRDKNVLAVGVLLELQLEVLKVDDHIHGGFDVNGLSTGVFDGARDGTEREGIANNLTTGLETGRLEQKHEGRTARVEADTVLVTSVLRDGQLGLTDGAFLGFLDVVAIETTAFHKVQSSLLTFDRDRVGGLNVTGDVGAVLQSVVQYEDGGMKG